MNESRPRILIVEDDAPTAAKFQRALELVGDCVTAEDSYEAYRQWHSFGPQLILLDIILEGETKLDPEEAGVEMLREIRKWQSPSAEIPVIVVTAVTDPEIEVRCRELGAVEFFSKPVDLQTLREAVVRALSKQVKVFISSTMRDLEAERLHVKRAIQNLGKHYLPVLAEDWTASPASVKMIWQQKVHECTIFILLLGSEYGRTDPVTDLSAIEDEYNQAYEAGKPILVFDMDMPESERTAKLRSFRAMLRKRHLIKSCSSIDELYDEVQKALLEIANQH